MPSESMMCMCVLNLMLMKLYRVLFWSIKGERGI